MLAPERATGTNFETQEFQDDVDEHERKAVGDSMAPAIAKAFQPSKEHSKSVAFKAYLSDLKTLRGH